MTVVFFAVVHYSRAAGWTSDAVYWTTEEAAQIHADRANAGPLETGDSYHVEPRFVHEPD